MTESPTVKRYKCARCSTALAWVGVHIVAGIFFCEWCWRDLAHAEQAKKLVLGGRQTLRRPMAEHFGGRPFRAP